MKTVTSVIIFYLVIVSCNNKQDPYKDVFGMDRKDYTEFINSVEYEYQTEVPIETSENIKLKIAGMDATIPESVIFLNGIKDSCYLKNNNSLSSDLYLAVYSLFLYDYNQYSKQYNKKYNNGNLPGFMKYLENKYKIEF